MGMPYEYKPSWVMIGYNTLMPKRQQGLLFGVVAAVVIGLNIAPGKILLLKYSPLFISWSTTIVAGFIFLPLVFISHKLTLESFRRQDWFFLVIMGILASGLALLFLYQGISIVPISEAVFLLRLEVVFGSLTAFLWLKQKLLLCQILGMIIMFIGVYFLTGVESFSLNVGHFYLVSAAFFFGLTDIMTKKINNNIPSSAIVANRNLFGGLFLTPFVINQLNSLTSLNLIDGVFD